MRRTAASLLLLVGLLAGCTTVPVIDANGEPVLNDDGTPKTKQVLNAGKVTEGAAAVAPFLPPPFGQALPLLAGLATLVINRKGNE